MTPYYLKFADEAEANSVLITTVDEISDEDGSIIVQASVTPNYANIDTIGLIYKLTGEMLMGEDGEYPEMAPIEGWHVNVRLVDGEDAEALEPFEVSPQTPVRVWG
jgi:hypothetical protein